MSIGEWIQSVSLATTILAFLVTGIIGLLRLSHIIVDIEKRQQRIDIVAEDVRTWQLKMENKWQNLNWKNSIVLIGLGLVLTSLLIIHSLREKA